MSTQFPDSYTRVLQHCHPEGEHLIWDGDPKNPVLMLDGKFQRVRPWLYRRQIGEPPGPLAEGCGVRGCLTPAHQVRKGRMPLERFRAMPRWKRHARAAMYAQTREGVGDYTP